MQEMTEKKVFELISLPEDQVKKASAVFESRGLLGQEKLVEQLKFDASVLMARINNISIPPGNTEAGRLVSLAKTKLEESVMWAVKAVSRYNPSTSNA